VIRLVGLAGAFVAFSAVVSGSLLAYTRAARLSGWLLALAGGSGVIGLWLLDNAATVPAGQFLLVLAGLALIPSALWAYPRPRWQHAVDVVLGGALIGPGLVACFYTRDPDALIVMGMTAVMALVAQTWWRLEHSTGHERRALSWVALALAASGLASLVLQFVAWNDVVRAVAVAILACVPIAMAVGALRPESVDVRGLAVTTGVAAAIAVGYVAYFVGTIGLLQVIGLSDPPPSTLAVVGLIGAVAVRPVAKALRGVMDEILFGGRPDPLDAANRVVDTIGRDPDEALEAVRSALSLPYVALRRGDETLARSGEPGDHLRRIVADGDGADATILEVGMRPGDLRLTSDDLRVLRLVTPLMVQLVLATELSTQLQQSRTRALTGIADERRRLRNELHDDLGPTLTGVALTTDAARNLIGSDPSAAQDLLAAVRHDVTTAIEQVRHITYGMRPPALDEIGLVEALRQQSLGLSQELKVDFTVDGDLDDLPAAVEVAAYRVAMEALTNVARHSSSKTALVTLSRTGTALTVDVQDKGGATAPWPRGVGLASMQERVIELGGTMTAGPGHAGGGVRVMLPLDIDSPASP
jgi:signal transduction histidine kinase